MKVSVRYHEHTIVAQIGLVLTLVGMVLFAYVPWLLGVGVGLVIGDTLDAEVEEDAA